MLIRLNWDALCFKLKARSQKSNYNYTNHLVKYLRPQELVRYAQYHTSIQRTLHMPSHFRLLPTLVMLHTHDCVFDLHNPTCHRDQSVMQGERRGGGVGARPIAQLTATCTLCAKMTLKCKPVGSSTPGSARALNFTAFYERDFNGNHSGIYILQSIV